MIGLDRAKASQKRNYDTKARVLQSLKPGEMVRVRLPGEQNWSLATRAKQVGPRSYEVGVVIESTVQTKSVRSEEDSRISVGFFEGGVVNVKRMKTSS